MYDDVSSKYSFNYFGIMPLHGYEYQMMLFKGKNNCFSCFTRKDEGCMFIIYNRASLKIISEFKRRDFISVILFAINYASIILYDNEVLLPYK